MYEFIGKQGLCSYYWRIFRDGHKELYYQLDGGILSPVAY